jgi:hypothetical protein
VAISINWATKVISVPQADLTFISGTLYELNTDTFRLTLKSLEDDETGMIFDDTHKHNTEVTLAGVTYARTVEIINGYTITFENGSYRVRLVGSNNNISDVTNLNQVSILSQNSAGLISGVGGIADAVWDEILSGHVTVGSAGKTLSDQLTASGIFSYDISGYGTPGTFGYYIRMMAGLMQSNYVLDQTIFNSSGVLTSARIRIFPNSASASAATNGGIGEGEIVSFTVSAQAAANLVSIYKVIG